MVAVTSCVAVVVRGFFSVFVVTLRGLPPSTRCCHTQDVSRLTLSRQLLLLQTLIVVLVVTVVAGVSLVQTDAAFRADESRRLRGTAESVATESLVRVTAAAAAGEGRTGNPAGDVAALEEVLWSRLELRRASIGASYLMLVAADGTVLSSPVRPGSPEDTSLRADVLQGATWAGTGERFGRRTIEAQTAVFGDATVDSSGQLVGGQAGQLLGYVIVGRYYPSRLEVLGTAAPSVFLYLALAGAIGVAGSLLLARRVKRQTLGLEPSEIAALVEQREAMLHGVREGVVGVDLGGTVAFANDEAAELLGLEGDVIGRRVDDLGTSPEVAAVLRGEATGRDRAVAVGERLLVLNSRPVLVRGRQTGWVTSMRDRTQLLGLQQELANAEAGTDTLRAQVHEFRNRLHAIAGMAELERYDDLRGFVQEVISRLDGRMAAVSGRVEDPAVAALLVAKASRADELGIEFVVSDGSRLGQHEPALSADLVTVVGNLVDNAFEAVPRGRGRVAVDLQDDGTQIVVQVRDTGAGFGADELARAFETGWSTKAGEDAPGRGFGLALTRMACRRHGGDVSIQHDHGAVLRAELRVGEVPAGA